MEGAKKMITVIALIHLGSSLISQANRKLKIYPRGPVITAIMKVFFTPVRKISSCRINPR